MPAYLPLPRQRRTKGAIYLDPEALREREEDTSIFGAIMRDDLEEALRLADQPEQMALRDPTSGASPIHDAFLYGKYEIGKELVRRHLECALQTYPPGQYEGENVLHIVIIQQNIEMVRWLLEQMPELLNSEAVGAFFNPQKGAYFGGYPLLFAVATNQFDMLDAILATTQVNRSPACVPLKNSIFLRDCHGNTALHMAVIHGLPDMYDYAMARAKEGGTKSRDCSRPFQHWMDRDGLTPLSLAAAMGKVEMFEHILKKHSKDAWSYGPIRCRMVPLMGLEQPAMLRREAGKGFYRSPEVLALECACAGPRLPLSGCLELRNSKVPEEVEQGRLDIVMSPAIKQLLDAKWRGFGRRAFFRKLALVLLTLVLWTTSFVIPGHWRLAPGNLTAFPINNGFILTCEVGAVVCTLWRCLGDVYEIAAKGRAYFSRTRGAAAMDNVLSLSFTLFFLLFWCFRLAGMSDVEDVFATLAAWVGWCGLLFFLLGFRSTGPFVVMIKEIIRYDMLRFAAVFVAVLLSYTTALYLLSSSTSPSVATYFLTLKYLLLQATAGQFPFDQYNDGPNMWLENVLVITYTIFVNIMLINLLIAMMGNTYSTINDESEKRWYVERANIMFAFESEISPEEMERVHRPKYAEPLRAQGGGTADPKDIDADDVAQVPLYFPISLVDQEWKERIAARQAAMMEARREAEAAAQWLKTASLPPRVGAALEGQEAGQRAAVARSEGERWEYLRQAAQTLREQCDRLPHPFGVR